jgi:glucose-6-phosphate dehydrogenase assembly protein OpcA
MLAQRRITDAAESSRPVRALEARRTAYTAGDTDLAWTRITPWRALVASSLDQPFERITAASVSAQRSNPSGLLLASWLQRGLGVPVTVHNSRGPGITGVTVHTEGGDISITRPDGRVARMVRPGFPDREAALQRRSIEGLIAEELRRLDPDEVYGETLAALPDLGAWSSHSDSATAEKRAPARKPSLSAAPAGSTSSATKAAASKAPATKAAATKAAATKAAAKKAAAKSAPTKRGSAS